MRPVHGQVLRDEISVADEVMLFAGDRSEVVIDDAQDEPQALAALRAGCVIDHVFGDEIVEDGVVARLLASKQFVDDSFRASLTHDASIA
jgi:hypothetical protein